jgi:hypothetical protein
VSFQFSRMESCVGFFTEYYDGGKTRCWTLTSLLGYFLREIEDLFGKRDPTWTPLGIEFCGVVPQIWYPGFPESRHIILGLSESAATHPDQALFQLAHETVHLLDPLPGVPSNFLEEGMATWFSLRAVKRFQLYRGLSYERIITNKRYQEALSSYVESIKLKPTYVKTLREQKINVKMLRSRDMLHVNPDMGCQKADILCSSFEPHVM